MMEEFDKLRDDLSYKAIEHQGTPVEGQVVELIQKVRDLEKLIEDNLEAIIELIPSEQLVRSCEGGGPENKLKTLAISVSKMAGEINHLRK